jgi:hypothetical protein
MSASRTTRWLLFIALIAVAATSLYGWFHSNKVPQREPASQSLPTHAPVPAMQAPTLANSGKGNEDKPSPAAGSANIDVRTMVACRAALLAKSHVQTLSCL